MLNLVFTVFVSKAIRGSPIPFLWFVWSFNPGLTMPEVLGSENVLFVESKCFVGELLGGNSAITS